MMIKMATVTRRFTGNYNHKKEKTRITKVKIKTKRIANSCNQKTRERRQ